MRLPSSRGAALFLILGIAALGGGLFILQTEAAQKKVKNPRIARLYRSRSGPKRRNPPIFPIKQRNPDGAWTSRGTIVQSGPWRTVRMARHWPRGAWTITIKLWDLKTGKESATLKGHKNR